MRLPKPRLRFFNNFLTILVALLAVYIIVAPYLPQFEWWLKHDSPVKTIVRPNPPVTAPTVSSGGNVGQQAVKGDQLIVPALDMREVIHEGKNKWALHFGVWRLPHTSTPDKGGNTVLVGHRFTYAGPAVFYYLDKVVKNDPISLVWSGKVYNYRVEEIRIVPPSEISVEANTEAPQLTIYTCTPLWTSKMRLVIIAKPVEAF